MQVTRAAIAGFRLGNFMRPRAAIAARFRIEFDRNASEMSRPSASASAIAASAEKFRARMPMARDWNSTAMPRSKGSFRNGKRWARLWTLPGTSVAARSIRGAVVMAPAACRVLRLRSRKQPLVNNPPITPALVAEHVEHAHRQWVGDQRS